MKKFILPVTPLADVRLIILARQPCWHHCMIFGYGRSIDKLKDDLIHEGVPKDYAEDKENLPDILCPEIFPAKLCQPAMLCNMAKIDAQL